MSENRHNLRSRGKGHASETTAPAEPAANEVAPVDKAHREEEEELEFGGAWGTLAMMTGFPTLFYYLYACLYFYDGKLATPEHPLQLAGPGGWVEFVKHIATLVWETAMPTKRATAIYLIFVGGQFLLAFVMPGVWQKGLPLKHRNGLQLDYYCNAYAAQWATAALVGAAHFTGVFNLAEVIDLYGPLLTVASIFGFAVAAVTYLTGENYRMSGNVVYDYFMGARLNPRVWSVDIKMFFEIRVSWSILFALAMGAVAKQKQEYGYVSGNTALFAYGVGLYLNACGKGEQYIPQTWDMNYEKFGWLLSYWNVAGVPFSYAYAAIYMATHDPKTYAYPKPVLSVLFVLITAAQFTMDIAMAQKSHFKALKTGTYIKRHTFPQLPFAELDNPKTFPTQAGELLVDGLWAYLRKPNYIADWIQALIWGASAGVHSVIPYYYPLFHCTMLLHRNSRDDIKCARKYGDDWRRYKELVPYSYIPYVL
ncbi:C-24(28) sterol reductase [Rhodotorula kratochvilovae]